MKEELWEGEDIKNRALNYILLMGSSLSAVIANAKLMWKIIFCACVGAAVRVGVRVGVGVRGCGMCFGAAY